MIFWLIDIHKIKWMRCWLIDTCVFINEWYVYKWMMSWLKDVPSDRFCGRGHRASIRHSEGWTFQINSITCTCRVFIVAMIQYFMWTNLIWFRTNPRSSYVQKYMFCEIGLFPYHFNRYYSYIVHIPVEIKKEVFQKTFCIILICECFIFSV